MIRHLLNPKLLFRNPNSPNFFSLPSTFARLLPPLLPNRFAHLLLRSSMASPAKIVAEYAKSNRSSCKKCSEAISSKSLRLGLVTHDPRGYDATKWHHVKCFSFESQPIESIEEIDGFSSLKSEDQEGLKTLADGGDWSPEEGNDGETRKSSKEPKVNIVAEYAKSSRSSCKKCSETIPSKSLRVGLLTKDPRGYDATKWHHVKCLAFDTLQIESVEKIDGFSSLKSDDQEGLKKLVDGGDWSPEEGIAGEKEKRSKESKVNIAAEYAKSGRSFCKKCSETIPAKSLRIGLVTKDPRGYDATKWHHVKCFSFDTQPIESVEKIDGFSSLKTDDQEGLKKMFDGGDLSPKEGNDHEKVEVEGKKSKARKSDEIGDDHEESNSKKLKLSPSGKEAELSIVFSSSDVKDNYKDATLLPEWKAFQTIIFLERSEGLHDSSKIAAFDFDGCLAKTSVQRVGADAWSLMFSSIPVKLKSLYNDGYKLVIFSNEANIERWKNKRQVAVDSKLGRLNNFIKRVSVPIQVFIACSSGKGDQAEDPFRKPKPGMWRIMEKYFNSGIPIDMDKSFYVGDAAGRNDDHGDGDIKFAEAIGVKFYVPEDYFAA